MSDKQFWNVYPEGLLAIADELDRMGTVPDGDVRTVFILDNPEDGSLTFSTEPAESGWAYGWIVPSAYGDGFAALLGGNQHSDYGFDSDQLRRIAGIIQAVNDACEAADRAFTGDDYSRYINLGARLPIDWDGDIIGYAEDEVGGVYAFEALYRD